MMIFQWYVFMPKFKIGNKTVNLGNNEFIAQGGEGSVYAKGNTAYKIYLDSNRMIPLGKMQELSKITSPRVIKPEEVVYCNNKPVGYTMRFVKNTQALCQLFTRSFKDRNSISFDNIISLIKDMRDTIDHIHDKDVLIVDLNEMNFLVDNNFEEVYFIDADSYQTRNFRATALMESVRDRHNPGVFNTGTDWFAFAVVTFQLFIGIHPYKGRHSSLKGFDDRMSANVSVFNKDVKIPRNCYKFDVIPKGLRDWYYEVFERTLRTPPPTSFDTSRSLMTVGISMISASFDIREIKEFSSKVIYYCRNYGVEIIVTNDKVYSSSAYIDIHKIPAVGCYGTDPYIVWRDDDKVRVAHVVSRKEIDTTYLAESLMTYAGRVFIKYESSILELSISNNYSKIVVMATQVASVLPNATKLYPGVVVQDMLGACVINVFPKERLSYQYRLDELKGHKIVDARFDNGILMLMANHGGQFSRFVYVVDDTKCKLVRKVDDVNIASINFVTLDSGVCVAIDEQGLVEAFNIRHPDKIKIIDDDSLCGDIKLFKSGSKVYFGQDNKLYSLSMK